MTNEDEKLSLRVAEAPQKDVGRGLVRIDPLDLTQLGVSIGDVVEITGKRTTVARAMPAYPEQRGQKLVQMDGILRANAQTGLDDRVSVRRVVVQPARNIVLVSAQAEPRSAAARKEGSAQHGGKVTEGRYLARLMDGIPVVTRDQVRVDLFGTRAQTFTVTETVPPGPVLIGPATVIRISAPGKEGAAGSERGAITYEDIGGLKRVMRRIREMIELPMRYPEVFERLGIDPPKGVLLHGPPGCGKTLIARAVAHETSAYFIHINGPEIVDKYYGASEANLRNFFEDARAHAPAIIFIDEIDALAPKREEMSGDRQVERRVVVPLMGSSTAVKTRTSLLLQRNCPQGAGMEKVLVPVPEAAMDVSAINVAVKGPLVSIVLLLVSLAWAVLQVMSLFMPGKAWLNAQSFRCWGLELEKRTRASVAGAFGLGLRPVQSNSR